MKSEKTLSILINESGDFGKFDSKDPNYHVVMVIHEQQDDITDRVKTLIERSMTAAIPIITFTSDL